MTLPTYPELVCELFPRLAGGIRWGTDRTQRLLAAVGDPHHRYRVLHVGGTNGKGSVSAMLASVLQEAGHRVGLYTSPHLCSFRERVQVGGLPLSEDAIVAAAHRLWPEIRREEPSFFEATTAIAFLAFAEAGVEVAVVEVGLGGRLDATNVVAPEGVALTDVALDHAEFLGETRVSVASEKAGIIKPGVPVATMETDADVLAVFRRRAAELDAPLAVVDPASLASVRTGVEGTRFRLRTRSWGELSIHVPLMGAHQARNAALAVRVLERLPPEDRPGRDALLRGLARVYWPGRLQWERIDGRSWIFDAAHNPAAIEALVSALRALPVPRPRVAVVGVLSDKDWRGMLPPLLDVVDALVLTVPPTAPEHRRWDPDDVVRRLPPERATVVRDFRHALAAAAERAGEGSVIVTGSFHTVGDALCLLGRAPWGRAGADPPLPGSASAA